MFMVFQKTYMVPLNVMQVSLCEVLGTATNAGAQRDTDDLKTKRAAEKNGASAKIGR
ncbi:protein of unknown function [Methylorubrum extorquens]|uniref:Uncharacterized protein n=1 Tax=Methylorubrum extorquens TaxID=408 RepID=A0A2N9AJY3_METEX|nr:protein of unknown function [Methylorubrum extorquens]